MGNNPIRVCIAGITGWTGSEIARAILKSDTLNLVGAVARRSAGLDIGDVLGTRKTGIGVAATIEEALRLAGDSVDVVVDFTSPDSVKARALACLSMGVRVVIGTSGLTGDDYAEIENKARSANLGVIACGNFSITAALAKRFSLLAAEFLPSREIIDYASAEKPDAPSGTTRELAEEMAKIAPNTILVPIEKTLGEINARGAAVSGTQVHSIRQQGFMISFESIFGLPDERLTIRHDAGTGAKPYVNGTLLAIRKVMAMTGLVRGMDRLLFPD